MSYPTNATVAKQAAPRKTRCGHLIGHAPSRLTLASTLRSYAASARLHFGALQRRGGGKSVCHRSCFAVSCDKCTGLVPRPMAGLFAWGTLQRSGGQPLPVLKFEVNLLNRSCSVWLLRTFPAGFLAEFC
jgi:hypothetical protein